MPRSNNEFLTVKVACEILEVSPNTLRSWGANGKIAEYRHPVNNYRLFREQDVRALRRKLENPKPRKSLRRKAK